MIDVNIFEEDCEKANKLLKALVKRPYLVGEDALQEAGCDAETFDRIKEVLVREGAIKINSFGCIAVNNDTDAYLKLNKIRILYERQKSKGEKESLSKKNLRLENRKLRWELPLIIGSLIISLVALARSFGLL